MAAPSAFASQLDSAALFQITVIVVNNRSSYHYYTIQHCIEMNAGRVKLSDDDPASYSYCSRHGNVFNAFEDVKTAVVTMKKPCFS